MSYPAAPSGPPAAMVTPEAVPLDFELANIGSRFLALLLDWLIQGSALFLLGIGLGAAFSGADLSFGVMLAFFFVLYFLVIFGYPIALETLWRGRTVGKAALGLRVVTKEGAPIRFRHAAIRAALGLVDFVLTYGAAAVICVLTTRDNQRLGDLVAGTIVLRERSGLKAPVAVGFSVPPGMEAYAASLDLAGFSADDYQAARAFLMRAPSLPHQVRTDLAVQLATPLAARVRPAPPPGTYPEAFLACVAAIYQHRQRSVAPAPPLPPQQPPVAYPPPPPGASRGTGFERPPVPASPAAAEQHPAKPAPIEGGFSPPA